MKKHITRSLCCLLALLLCLGSAIYTPAAQDDPAQVSFTVTLATGKATDYATLKVLGYHQKEIRRLITTENDLLTGLGVLLGVGPGFWLTGAILESCASKTMEFVPFVSWKSVLIGCVVTYAFSVFVTRFLARKVRGIDMVAALKSVE